MSLLILVVVVLLATIRIVWFFTEDALWERAVMQRLRKWSGLPFTPITPEQRVGVDPLVPKLDDVTPAVYLNKKGFAVSVFDCGWCIGFWVSVLTTLVAILLVVKFGIVITTLVFVPLALNFVVALVWEKLSA